MCYAPLFHFCVVPGNIYHICIVKCEQLDKVALNHGIKPLDTRHLHVDCTLQYTVQRPNSWTKLHRGQILGRNPDKVLWVFLYSQSNLIYSLASRFLFLQSHATSHCKGERRKTWYKTISPSLWFKKSIQKPQVWELARLCPETSTKLYVHEFCFSVQSTL